MSGRRGSVRQEKNGTWYFIVDVVGGRGQRTQTRRRGFRTRREAQAALNETLNSLGRQTYVPPSRLTLGAYLTDAWLPAIESTVRATTFDSYSRTLRRHVVNRFAGHVLLQDFDPPTLNKLYATLLAGDDANRKLGPRSVAYVGAILGRALGDAVRWNLIVRNPCLVARPPRARIADRPPQRTWTGEEVQAFLTDMQDDRLAAFWRLLASTGIRRGEGLGLRWSDVDLMNRAVSINRTLVRRDPTAGNPGLMFAPPKTSRGRRLVYIDALTAAEMRVHRKRQAEERLLAGTAWDDSDLVFCERDGAPLNPDYVSDAFKRYMRRSSLPRIRLHDLRHTWATLALRAGVHPKVVQEQLGHSTISITMDIYSHAIPTMQADAVEQVAALFKNGV
jgi:integrase